VQGEEHPETLRWMGNLASILWGQRRFKRVRGGSGAVVEVRKRVLGEEHPDTLTSMSNLAEIFRAQGDQAAARRGGRGNGAAAAGNKERLRERNQSRSSGDWG